MQRKESMLTERIQKLQPSATIEISSKAKALKKIGKNVLVFSAGEPDFNTPEVIRNAAKKAIDDGFTKYTQTEGIPELLNAIQSKFKNKNNLNYETNQIIVSNGGKQAIFNIMQALIEKNDEVIIPAPYWVTYPIVVKYSGGTPVIIHTDEKNNFKITPKQLREAITDKTKLIILASPSNPTGSVYTINELNEFAEILKETNIMVLSDEIYEDLIYINQNHISMALVNNDMYKRTITVNGLSKSVAMTGWRFGYLASSDTKLVKKMISLQSQTTSNICSIVQRAAIPFFNGEAEDDIQRMKLEFFERRDIAHKLINEISGLSANKPDGAFYLFVNIQQIEKNSMLFCKKLLEEKEVAVVPGVAFGTEGYFRFSFASDLESIKEGIRRIGDFCESYASS
jgi:aspartate aminotransferase